MFKTIKCLLLPNTSFYIKMISNISPTKIWQTLDLTIQDATQHEEFHNNPYDKCDNCNFNVLSFYWCFQHTIAARLWFIHLTPTLHGYSVSLTHRVKLHHNNCVSNCITRASNITNCVNNWWKPYIVRICCLSSMMYDQKFLMMMMIPVLYSINRHVILRF